AHQQDAVLAQPLLAPDPHGIRCLLTHLPGAAAVLSDHDRRDALRDVVARNVQLRRAESPIGVRMHVDEARRHDLAGGIDRPRSRGAGQVPDLHDSSAGNGDVGAARCATRAIDDLAAANQEIVLLGEEGRGRYEQEDGRECGGERAKNHELHALPGGESGSRAWAQNRGIYRCTRGTPNRWRSLVPHLHLVAIGILEERIGMPGRELALLLDPAVGFLDRGHGAADLFWSAQPEAEVNGAGAPIMATSFPVARNMPPSARNERCELPS